MISVQAALGHAIVSLNKSLYDDYLCLVAGTIKQQIYVRRSQMSISKLRIRSTSNRVRTIRPKYRHHRRFIVAGG